jgi:hypothetical protein
MSDGSGGAVVQSTVEQRYGAVEVRCLTGQVRVGDLVRICAGAAVSIAAK